MYTTEKIKPEEFVPQCFESKGQLTTVNGEVIPYHTVAEDNVFYDKNGKAIASIFSYSYFRSDVDNVSERPVVFGFNGGPGSASYYVHAGFLGVKRVTYDEEINRETSLPKYVAKDNEYSLLEVADVVVVDVVNAGYGLLIDDEHAKDFMGIEKDAEALLMFISKWLKKYHRFASPKYLCGESYGCTRSAVAAGFGVTGTAHRDYAIRFDGIIMIGNTVTNGKYFGKELGAPKAVLEFQTHAAVHWYHNHPTDQPVEEFVEEAKEFANHDYLLALYKGESLPAEEKEEIIRKITYYTGCSREYLLERDLVIDCSSFRSEVVKEKGLAVSRYDGRFLRPRYTPEKVEKEEGPGDDASADQYDSFYLSVMIDEIARALNIEMDRTYVPIFNAWNEKENGFKWDFSEEAGITGKQLNLAMRQTFGMRLFFTNGRYDECTHTGYIDYLLDHVGLPKERITRKNYNSGHMIYYGEDNIKEFTDDIKAFIRGEMPHN